MKRVLLIAVYMIALLSLSFGQGISITSADMPVPGDEPRFSIADTLLQIDTDLTGPNYNWDFSMLNPIAQRKDSFISKGDLPFALRLTLGSAPASVISYINTPDSVGDFSLSGGFDIFNTTSTEFASMGQATVLLGLLPVYLEKDPDDFVYRFPMQFGNMDSSFSVGTLDLAIPTLGNVYVQQERKRVNEVDGYGMIKTPYGSFDVIRVKSFVTGSDTIAFDTLAIRTPAIPTVEYKWLSNDEHVPILQINATSFGGAEIITQVFYRDSLRAGVPTVGIERKLTQLEATIYPNPTQDQFFVDWDHTPGQEAVLELLDYQGRVSHRQILRGNAASISVGSLASGTYIVRIQSADKLFLDRLIVK